MAKVHFGVSPTSVVLRAKLMDSSVSTGAGLTGLTFSSTGLRISTIKIGEVSATSYTAAGSTIETITTLGTYAAPTATKCRFKEVDSTNHPGIYELQLADARFSATDSLLISINGATNLAQADLEVQCTNLASNMTQILGTAVSTPATAGILDVNLKNIANAAVSTSTAQLGVNVVSAAGTAWASGAITDAVFATATYPKAIRTATAQGGSAGYITLDTSAVSADDFYKGCSIKIVSGTGAGQSRTIIFYVGSSKFAYIDSVWAINPAADSVFVIQAGKLTVDIKNVGLVVSSTSGLTTIASTAITSADYYTGSIIDIISGTGAGQSRCISFYSAGRVITVSKGWSTVPDTTSVYVIRGLGSVDVGSIQGILQTSRDIGASVLLSSGTGTGQLDFTSGVVKSNMTQVDGAALASHTTGYIPTQVSLSGTMDANVIKVDGINLSAHASGMIPADMRSILGTTVSTPATAGILDVNVKNMNNVAATSITTINANQGTTQPVNFTGTGATAYVKTDMVDISGSAIVTSAAQIGVNTVQLGADATAVTNLKSDYVQTQTSAQRPSSAKFLSDMIDYQKGHHTQTGIVVYVNGTNGNDSTGTGARNAPYKTISKALTDCTGNNHDVIILLPDSTGNPTTISEAATISITKNYVQIRGVGRDVNVTNILNTDVFSVSANGVGMSGFRVTTAGGTANGITAVGDFNRFQKLWIEAAHQDAINLGAAANRNEIIDCYIITPARDGIRINSGGGASAYQIIQENLIRGAIGTGINLLGVDSSYSRIQRNTIRDCGTGISVATGTLSTVISDNRLANNTTQISDLGTNTYNQWNFLDTDALGRVTTSNTSLGSALNAVTESYVLSAGTQSSGTIASAQALDNVNHEHTDTAGAMDLYYQHDVGTYGIPVNVNIVGRLNSSNDTLGVYAYNWGSTTWQQIGSYVGTNSTSNITQTYPLLATHVGTGGNLGKVRIRFYAPSGLTSATLRIDFIYVGYTNTSVSVVTGDVNGKVLGGGDSSIVAVGASVNATQIDGVSFSAHAAGMVPADMRSILGTAVSTPATAGILDVNVKKMNNVATTSITTINTNQGTTQPVNFTGTGASAYVKSDMVDIAGVVVSSATAQIGVNVVSQNNIDFSVLQKASLNAATPTSVGSVTSPVTVGTNNDKTNYTLSASEHTVIGVDAASAILITPANKLDTDVSGRANIGKVYSVSAAAQKLSISAPTMITGTVTSAAFAPTTTQFECADITDSGVDFYKYRTAIFTSGNLNHQARNISAYSKVGSNGRFTVDPLTEAPVHGDSVIIV